MHWRKLRHLAEYAAFRVIICLLRALSPRQAFRLAEGLALIVHRGLPRKWTRYEVARQNLRIAFGDRYTDGQLDRLIRRMWGHLFRMVVEMAQLPRKLRLDNCAEVLEYRNRDETVRVLCSERPVIFLSGHFGNWEMAVATFGLFGFPMGVVARDLDNPYLHEWFRRYRQSAAHRLISKKGGGPEMVETLEQQGRLALLGDQDAGSRGLFVRFFGKEASTFKSIALLALEYDAILCVGYARRLRDDFEKCPWSRYEIGTEEFIDPRDHPGPEAVREITQRYTSALERLIRRAPEQYFWLHRRWKSVPRRRGKVRKAA